VTNFPANESIFQFGGAGRISAWQMINAILGSTIQFVKSLEAETLRFKTRCVVGEGTNKLDGDDKKRMSTAVKVAHELFDDADDKNIDYCIKELERSITKNVSNTEMYATLSSLADAVLVALANHFYYCYPAHKAQVFYNWQDEWGPVYSSFPDAYADIFLGVDCWAMGHDTASVFHMMRVLELGLSWLAKDVGEEMGVDNWHNVIDRIEKRIREAANTMPKGLEKTSRLQFLSQAAKEFRYFKDGRRLWRNYVSHNRGIYDEHQARSVLEHVKSFMLTLATHATAVSSEQFDQPQT